ncbi:hypothetical protein [Paraliomyxa miuraensis]|uniref:hypothetical protein n=1 Tax=Paraliomyxa miuraensis TaxID=376150 RepID=UPI002258EF16|nr:hypothetical protein [Paraliomyxa miuraensis]MCX4247216.1 hypothetical protein [Paraliomyxa miuraensis]
MKALMIGVALGSAGLVAGCKGGAATPTERLWVSGVPTSPKAPLTAFVTMRSENKGEGYLGAFYQGSLLRGGHEVFEWKDTGKDRASVRFLQDDVEVKLTLSPCNPSTGFDYCLELRGDSPYARRYQSRKRWIVRRPGRTRDAAAGLVTHAMLELADDDDELAQALDLAAEAAGISHE